MVARSFILASLALAVSAATNSTTGQDCEKIRSDCQSSGDPNESECAALYYTCKGNIDGLNSPAASTATYTTYTTVCPATSTTGNYTQIYTTTSTITSCIASCPTTAAQDCEKVRSDCQSSGDPNEAECAALYYACKGNTDGLNGPAATVPAGTGAVHGTAVGTGIPIVPTKTGSNFPVYTGAASSFKPAVAGLIAAAGFVALI